MTTNSRANARRGSRPSQSEANRNREALHRIRKTSEQFNEKLPGIRKRHADHWIVFRNGRVAFKSDSFGKSSDYVKEKGWDKSDVIIEFVSREPIAMIL